MVLGNTKWALDFSYYILDELFELADEFEPVFSDQEAFAQKGKILSGIDIHIFMLGAEKSQANGSLHSEIDEFSLPHSSPF